MSSDKNKTFRLHVKIDRFLLFNSNRIKTLASEVRNKTTVNRVHKLRVTIRKVRNTLSIMGISPESEKLKHLAKTLGDLRDIDVAIINSKKFDLKDRHLLLKRKSFSNKVKKNLKKAKVLGLMTELHAYEEKLASMPDSKLKHHVAEFKKELLVWKDKNLTLKNIHNFRKIMKRVKYFFEAVSVETVGLEMLHKCLGDLHDLIVLTDLSGHHAKIQKAILKDKKKAILMSKTVLQSSIKTLDKILKESVRKRI